MQPIAATVMALLLAHLIADFPFSRIGSSERKAGIFCHCSFTVLCTTRWFGSASSSADPALSLHPESGNYRWLPHHPSGYRQTKIFTDRTMCSS
jgi:hypothetical protein